MARHKYNDDGVDLSVLEQHTYADSPGCIFYTCPRCGREYLEDFLYKDEDTGETICMDCDEELHPENYD